MTGARAGAELEVHVGQVWGVVTTWVCFVLFYETSGLSLLLGKPAQREGARTGLEVLCKVLHPTLSRPERPDHNTGDYMP